MDSPSRIKQPPINRRPWGSCNHRVRVVLGHWPWHRRMACVRTYGTSSVGRALAALSPHAVWPPGAIRQAHDKLYMWTTRDRLCFDTANTWCQPRYDDCHIIRFRFCRRDKHWALSRRSLEQPNPGARFRCLLQPLRVWSLQRVLLRPRHGKQSVGGVSYRQQDCSSVRVLAAVVTVLLADYNMWAVQLARVRRWSHLWRSKLVVGEASGSVDCSHLQLDDTTDQG